MKNGRYEENNAIVWFLNNKLHREDGPAFEGSNGTQKWYINGEYHRENGPAIEFSKGSKYWYLNGKQHREDGPACLYTNGTKAWFMNDIELTEQEFNQWLDKKNLHIKLEENLEPKSIQKRIKI